MDAYPPNRIVSLQRTFSCEKSLEVNSLTNNGKESVLTGADISVPISIFVSGMFGHFTWKITGFMPDVLKQKKKNLVRYESI